MMHRTSSSRVRHGFSLIELLLAIFILGIGIISVAAVFPAGIIQQRRAQDDVMGPVVAEEALATIRSVVMPSDFGTFEQFGIFGPSNFDSVRSTPRESYLERADRYTVPGDFPWLRPSMYVAEPDAVIDTNDNAYGDIDIFSARLLHFKGGDWADAIGQYTATDNMGWPVSDSITSEFRGFGSASIPVVGDTHPLVSDGNDQGAFLFGIPFNRSRFDPAYGGADPLKTITQEDRFWPMDSGFAAGQKRPQYAWECMFRRHQGRMQVAIFVYRISASNSVGGYVASVQPSSGGYAKYAPPLPARFDIPREDGSTNYPFLRPFTSLGAADADGDGNMEGDAYLRAQVVGTDPAGASVLEPYELGWQAPGQWMLDPYGRIHRVVQGRRNGYQGPVRLARPIPDQPRTASSWSWHSTGDDPSAVDELFDSEVRSIWFIPPVDQRGISLTPVYVTVRDL